jgi:hypothetical protein
MPRLPLEKGVVFFLLTIRRPIVWLAAKILLGATTRHMVQKKNSVGRNENTCSLLHYLVNATNYSIKTIVIKIKTFIFAANKMKLI